MLGRLQQVWRHDALKERLRQGLTRLERIGSLLIRDTLWRRFLHRVSTKGALRRFGSARYLLSTLGLLIAFAAGFLTLDQERPVVAPGLADPIKEAATPELLGEAVPEDETATAGIEQIAEIDMADERAVFGSAEAPAALDPIEPQTARKATTVDTVGTSQLEGGSGGRKTFEWIDLLAKETDEELDDAVVISGSDLDPRFTPQAAAATPLADNTTEIPLGTPSPEAFSDEGGAADQPEPVVPGVSDPSLSDPGEMEPRSALEPALSVAPDEETSEGMATPQESREGPVSTTERVIDLPDPPEDPFAERDADAEPAFEPSIEIHDVPEAQLSLHAGKGRLVRLSHLIDKVLLADPTIADVHVVSPRLLYVFGSQVGGTDLFALAANGDVVASLSLDVMPDTEKAQTGFFERYPGSDVSLDALGRKVVASGEVEGLAEAYDVAALAQELAPAEVAPSNRTTISGSQQVNLRVRFAEIRRNDIYRLGINWQALIERGDFLIGLATGTFAFPGGGFGSGRAVGNETFGSAFGSFDSGSVDLDIVIDALQREGVVSILAEPNLTAMNGEPASFLAGGEFPFPVPSGDGDVTIEFKEFGVSLNFLPTLLGNDRIAIQVRPEVSQINFGSGFAVDGFVVPLLTVRRTQTTVELNSGQTFALAGLFQRNVTDDLDKFPFLGDIPILGKLFQSVRFQQEETELVILITPYLVKPVAERSLALPGDPPDRARLPRRNPPRSPVDDMTGFIID